MKQKIRPLHDRVVIERLEDGERSPGGIFIPDNAKEKPSRGVIVAVGPGKILDDGKTRALGVKVGDNVLFGKYSGNEIKLDGKELIIMREEDILGIVG